MALINKNNIDNTGTQFEPWVEEILKQMDESSKVENITGIWELPKSLYDIIGMTRSEYGKWLTKNQVLYKEYENK